MIVSLAVIVLVLFLAWFFAEWADGRGKAWAPALRWSLSVPVVFALVGVLGWPGVVASLAWWVLPR